MVDPIVRWCFTQNGAARWSQLVDMDDQDVMGQSAAYGMKFGVAISTDTGNSRSVAGFARSDHEYTDAEIAALTAEVQTLHDLTATANGMDKKMRESLHQLSVRMTHPANGQRQP